MREKIHIQAKGFHDVTLHVAYETRTPNAINYAFDPSLGLRTDRQHKHNGR